MKVWCNDGQGVIELFTNTPDGVLYTIRLDKDGRTVHWLARECSVEEEE